MRRRDFITLAGFAVSWPLVGNTQQFLKVHRVAFVHPATPVSGLNENGGSGFRALFQGLRRLGYVEGRNLVVERYSAGGRQDRYAELASDVVRTNPDIILAAQNALILSFKAATDKIPVVGFMADPVAFGIVASLAHPGGNITGVSNDAGPGIWGKRLEILREVVPAASKVGYLNVAPWSGASAAATKEAARQVGVSLIGPGLESPIQEREYRRVLGAMVQEHAEGLIVDDTSPNFTYRRLIVELAEKARLPTIYPYRDHFEIGGLIAYATSAEDLWGRLANNIDKILRGAKPADIPIYQAAKFELLLNLKAAKAIGIEMPTALLARADEVIQ